MDPAPHGADGYGGRLGDLLVAETYHVAHDDGLPELERQLEQRLLDVVTEADPVVLDVGAGRRCRVPSIDLLGEGCGGAPVATPDLVEEGVARDAPQPS